MARKRLKKGFTTGAAAAAAVKAALLSCFSDPPGSVDITFLTGERKKIEIKVVRRLSDTCYEALVIKDAGDDPDVTHKAEIGARVEFSEFPEKSVRIRGGKGVGRVTKPGLALEVGEPAINPGPRKMIRNSVDEVFEHCRIGSGRVAVEIFVPRGEVLAQKTLNARLGILGGISILGTTGIVTPMSHDAYIATIQSGISVAAASGTDTLVFTTGRRSERFAVKKFSVFKEEAFIQTGDFFKASIDMAIARPQIRKIIFTVFFGKAVKMAMGFAHTHAAKSELTMKKLSEWALQITGSRRLSEAIKQANTARHAFSFIYPEHLELVAHVGEQIKKNARAFSGHTLDIESVIFDFNGKTVFETSV